MRRVLPERLTAGWIVGGLIVFFLALNAWWLWTDTRAPGIDSGYHLQLAVGYRAQLQDWDLLGPFRNSVNYPPIIHLVGAISSLVGGLSPRVMVMGLNLVFLPLLALGCYLAGRVAYGARAGVLAAVFALGTPIVLSGFHEFLLDAPETGIVAITVGLLLLSDRFASARWSLLAGLAAVIGLLTKESFVLFVAGLVVVMLIRGGWRRPRNVLLFCLPALVIAGAWYVSHASQIQNTAHSLSSPQIFWYDHIPYPQRWSVKNFLWYGWSLVNVQLFLPLAALFVAGVVASVRRFWRARVATDYTPELIAGGFVGYVGQTMFRLHDPRYTTPALVYMAVLATGWIATARRPRLRVAGTAAVGLIAAINIACVTFGAAETPWVLRPFGGPKISPILERQFVVVGGNRYDGVAGPSRGDHVFDLLKAAKRSGAAKIAFYTGGGDEAPFNGNGMFALLLMLGIPNTPQDNPVFLGPRDIFIFRQVGGAVPGAPPPCTTLADGSTLYVLRGPRTVQALAQYPRKSFICPLRS